MRTYAVPEEADLPEVYEITATAFASSIEDVTKWLEVAGLDQVRLRHDGARVAACLLEIPMGHYWAGRSVPTIGIAGVGCALELRGRGHTRALMDAAIVSFAERQIATSTLFPATQALYRRSGYERAGILRRASITLSDLSKRPCPEGLEVRRLGLEDQSAVETLYKEFARGVHGLLDRGAYVFSRVYAPRSKSTRGFGFFFEGKLEAYLYLRQDHDDPSTHNHNLWLSDVQASSARGYCAIERFLFEQRSTADNVRFYSGAYSPLLSSLSEAYYEEERFNEWMLRICDVKAAFEGRGYPEDVRAELSLCIDDPLIERNRGNFTLTVEGGIGVLKPGGGGKVKIGIGALATLYSGFLSARTLRSLEWLQCEGSETALLERVFLAPLPSIVDMF